MNPPDPLATMRKLTTTARKPTPSLKNEERQKYKIQSATPKTVSFDSFAFFFRFVFLAASYAIFPITSNLNESEIARWTIVLGNSQNTHDNNVFFNNVCSPLGIPYLQVGFDPRIAIKNFA